MAFKFPFTNYHELNLTWILEQLKSLFEQSEENVTTIETYENRLTAVETELPSVSETASEASRAAAAAGSLAQTATQKADTAQENAVQAQGMAGTARREAEAAQTAANEATQAAQQAQATAQNFDGRITQAENDASQALEASRSFENRVQAAITTANNADQTATNAQGIAMRADQNAGAALDKIGDLSQLTTTAKQNLVVAVNEVKQNSTEAGQSAEDALDKIGDLSDLTTEAKQNLVAAINEAAQSGGGAVTSVNGKTGEVVLTSADISYNEETVAAELSDLDGRITYIDGFIGENSVTSSLNYTYTNIIDNIELKAGETLQAYFWGEADRPIFVYISDVNGNNLASGYYSPEQGNLTLYYTALQDTVVVCRFQKAGTTAITVNCRASLRNAPINQANNIIAPVLENYIAASALSVNNFVIIYGYLYRITAPIAAGGTITVGTNASRTTIAEILKSILG